MKTKYRVYYDGYWNYLQYEVKTTFFAYKIQMEWEQVFRGDIKKLDDLKFIMDCIGINYKNDN